MHAFFGHRDSLCAIALAASHEAKDNKAPANSSLHLQVAKVVSAHAASVSDSLLGVPLLCSAGIIPCRNSGLMLISIERAVSHVRCC